MPKIVDHLESVVAPLDNPIIMGHSAGGVFTQILLDKGYGAAAVVLNSAPTEGVTVAPLSQPRSTFPILKNPANRHRAAGFTFEQFHYAFTNGVDEAIARPLYKRYAVAAHGGILLESVLANVKPGHQDTWVDYHNDDRAPLLFISGSDDHITPPASSGPTPSTTSPTRRSRRSPRSRVRTSCRRRGAGRRSPTGARVGARQRPSREDRCGGLSYAVHHDQRRRRDLLQGLGFRAAGRHGARVAAQQRPAGRRSSLSPRRTTASARSRTTAAGTAAPRRCGTATTWITTRTISPRSRRWMERQGSDGRGRQPRRRDGANDGRFGLDRGAAKVPRTTRVGGRQADELLLSQGLGNGLGQGRASVGRGRHVDRVTEASLIVGGPKERADGTVAGARVGHRPDVDDGVVGRRGGLGFGRGIDRRWCRLDVRRDVLGGGLSLGRRGRARLPAASCRRIGAAVCVVCHRVVRLQRWSNGAESSTFRALPWQAGRC